MALLWLVFSIGAVQAALFEAQADQMENPIRRIVTLLQKMQEEIAAEGKKDEELMEKYVCYCEKNDGELSDSTASLRAAIPEIEASITEAENLKAQLDQELAAHKKAREEAKEAITAAAKRREKEAAEFAAESSELSANIASAKAAIDALSKGLGASFLQSKYANTLRNMVLAQGAKLDRYDRETLTDFLSVNANARATVSGTGEIIGILKQLLEDMEKELAAITKAENTSITEYEGLVSAKEKEIQVATENIEKKMERAGETAVKIVSLKNDLEDTKESLGADEQFLMELKKSCSTADEEYAARKQGRAMELVAVAETIKILNDDDALDLFKKTLPSPALLQMRQGRDVRRQALTVLSKVKAPPTDFMFISLMLRGKKQGFEKVIKLIDNLVVTLGKEQTDDDAQRTWCMEEFDSSDDSEKDLKRRISGFETRISENEESIATLTDELAALKKGIKELDAAVEDATTQRKDAHKEFVESTTMNNGALQLLDVAKNRLNKFYNPALYKAPERRELTEEERIYVNSGGADPRDAEEAVPKGGIAGTGVSVFLQLRSRRSRQLDLDQDDDAPPPPPETMDAYTKKDSSGPTALIDKLKNDLEKDMLENEHDEQDAQKEYESFMSDSVAKRTADSKSITEKESQKAELEADLMGAKDLKKTKAAELMATQEYIMQLHGSCDFLVQNYDLRKKARADETEALKNAKAVLSGADYSFRQVAARKLFLAHA